MADKLISDVKSLEVPQSQIDLAIEFIKLMETAKNGLPNHVEVTDGTIMFYWFGVGLPRSAWADDDGVWWLFSPKIDSVPESLTLAKLIEGLGPYG